MSGLAPSFHCPSCESIDGNEFFGPIPEEGALVICLNCAERSRATSEIHLGSEDIEAISELLVGKMENRLPAHIFRGESWSNTELRFLTEMWNEGLSPEQSVEIGERWIAEQPPNPSQGGWRTSGRPAAFRDLTGGHQMTDEPGIQTRCVSCGRYISLRETGRRRPNGEDEWAPFEPHGDKRHHCRSRSGLARARNFYELSPEEREKFGIPRDWRPATSRRPKDTGMIA
jgi:hypothetical protein